MNGSTLYKLSPSDFKYLWEDCKHCYYQKVVNGLPTPFTPFPGIFSKMNSQLQTMALSKNVNEIIPQLPSGKIVSQEGWLHSKPLPNRNGCYIAGKFDLLTKFDDGSYGVIDLKITDPKQDALYKFKTQLHAYKFALENPDENEPVKISKLGLLVVSPSEVVLHKSRAIFLSKPSWIEFKINMEEFYAFIDEISDFLSGECPEPTKGCGYCDYRARFNAKIGSA